MDTLPPVDVKINEKVLYWNELAQHGWSLYHAGFVLMAGLMVVAVLLPSERTGDPSAGGSSLLRWFSRQRLRIGVAGFAGLMVLSAISFQTTIDTRRGFIADQERKMDALVKKITKTHGKEAAYRAQYMYLPEGDALKYMVLGNTAIAADYMWLTSLQFVSSSFRRGQKFDLLRRFYDTMLNLQPAWVEAAKNGGKVLSAIQKDRYKIESFYNAAVVANPDNWELAYEAGRVFVVPSVDAAQSRDYAQRAAEWFKKALSKKAVPTQAATLMKHLVAQFELEAGFIQESARSAYITLSDPANPPIIRASAAETWQLAHSMLQVNRLETLVGKYKRERGVNPPTITPFVDRLHAEGEWLPPAASFIPKGSDCYGFPIQYDAVTGWVQSKGVNYYRAMQASVIINQMIMNFDGEYGRAPKDLVELRDYLRSYFSQNRDIFTAPIREVLGADIDPTRSPLGSWNYDPAAGKIILPPECNATELYKNGVRLTETFGASEN